MGNSTTLSALLRRTTSTVTAVPLTTSSAASSSDKVTRFFAAFWKSCSKTQGNSALCGPVLFVISTFEHIQTKPFAPEELYGLERSGENDRTQVARGSTQVSRDRWRSREKQRTTDGRNGENFGHREAAFAFHRE